MKIRLSWGKGKGVKTLREKFRRYLWRSYLLRDKELDRIVLEAEVIDEGKKYLNLPNGPLIIPYLLGPFSISLPKSRGKKIG